MRGRCFVFSALSSRLPLGLRLTSRRFLKVLPPMVSMRRLYNHRPPGQPLAQCLQSLSFDLGNGLLSNPTPCFAWGSALNQGGYASRHGTEWLFCFVGQAFIINAMTTRSNDDYRGFVGWVGRKVKCFSNQDGGIPCLICTLFRQPSSQCHFLDSRTHLPFTIVVPVTHCVFTHLSCKYNPFQLFAHCDRAYDEKSR
ncbi:uncharacterized protein EV420DRAFT_1721882 [Desarmillaria tabescens]|uniref:Uncharacterized protein n=1 Tax=Armillaria tabescens TaxID=1929756 RepID=A0AA39JKT9_ARMTA|nr:uncharacterized protein EV420DRAFT_1721882 [Desarmillaria tabescens]KAK0444591.1 hypothetical protein EV420DRAFT_1721882 [Desarmillaria tabescens]